MNITLDINRELCIKCGKCVKVCPAGIFVQDEKNKEIGTVDIENCIVCGHCVAACPENAVIHYEFPTGKVHPVDYSLYPTPEQMTLRCKARRSNRAFSAKPIPAGSMKMILEAAHHAPTGSNAQHFFFRLLGILVLATHPVGIRQSP